MNRLGNQYTVLIAGLLIPFLLPCWTHGETQENLFKEANKTYEAEDFEKAIELYESIVDSGPYNGYVFFNLGNAYFRRGDLGKAVLNYERAKRLIPRYEDLRVNYERAIENLEDAEFNEFREKRVPLALRGLCQALSLNEVLALTASILMISALLVQLRLVWNNTSYYALSNYLLSFFLIMVIILLLVGTFKFRAEILTDSAIVIEQVVDVRSGPGTEQGIVFSIHQGTEVEIKRKRGEWTQVSLPNGYAGWLPAKQIQQV